MSHNNLVNMCRSICDTKNISLYKYMFDYVYFNDNMKGCISNDGFVDYITFLMSDFTYNNRFTVQSLSLPF